MNRIPFCGDLSVSPLCLGTAQFGTGVSKEEAKAQLSRFFDHGGNFIDTAHVYGDWGNEGDGLSERVIGEWLRETGARARAVLSTKGAHPHMQSMHTPRLSEAEILSDLEGSLQYLQTDVIDVYFLHRDNPAVPAADVLGWLESARRAGKIRHYGCSNWTLPRLREAEDAAAANGFEGYRANQLLWSLADVNLSGVADKTLVAMDEATHAHHAARGLSAMAFTALAHGYFQRRAARGPVSSNLAAVYHNPTNQALFELMDDANDIGFSPLDLSVGYLTHRPFPSVPIISFSSVAQLDEAVASAQVKLPPRLVEAMDGIKAFVYA